MSCSSLKKTGTTPNSINLTYHVLLYSLNLYLSPNHGMSGHHKFQKTGHTPTDNQYIQIRVCKAKCAVK